MATLPYSSMMTLRIRIFVIALSLAVAIGGAVMVAGAGQGALVAAVLAALATVLVSSVYLHRTVSDLRVSLTPAVQDILPQAGFNGFQAECDDLKALLSVPADLVEAQEARRRVQQDAAAQIADARQKLTLIVRNGSFGGAHERSQVHDAVTVMEQLGSAFAVVTAEIDELSGRTEERASISAQMTATTESIAENINQYSDFVVETSSSIEEMAHAIRETADNIRDLASSTEQSVSSITMISTSQATVRANSERSSTASESVRTQAQQGLRSMSATMKAMQEIAKSNDESFESINRLSRHSARVGEFLSVIQEVVEQTNLLSLNASIIAAQAGTRGRAFAVVAEEVRSLARRTSVSTREIEELVRNIQKETASVQRTVTQGKDKVKEGVKISSMANDALVMIDRGAEDAYKMVSDIALETTEQAANIQRISAEAEKNLERVRQVTLATEQQQQGANLIVKNLEQMRELAHRINVSSQEQASGNRLYLKNVMEDNERARHLKSEVSGHSVLAGRAAEAIRGVELQMGSLAAERQALHETLAELTRLIDLCHGETILELDDEVVTHA